MHAACNDLLRTSSSQILRIRLIAPYRTPWPIIRLLLHLARKKGMTQTIVVIVLLFVVEMVVLEVVVFVAVVVGVVADETKKWS